MWTRFKRLFQWLKAKITWRVGKRILYSFSAFIVLYYLIGMVLIEEVNRGDIQMSEMRDGQSNNSMAVHVAIELVDREVNQHSWISNDPFFKPGYMLDNMAHYQQGIISAIAIFSVELKDQLGRTRGSSQTDQDLIEVASSINYAPDKWYWDPAVSIIWPVATSEKQYNNALKRLRAYSQRLNDGEAAYDKRADNLLATLDKISLDIGSASDSINRKINNGVGCVLDTKADDLYYNIQGRAYAYYQLLRGLREDFLPVIEGRGLEQSWEQMEDSLKALISLDPMIVSNCDADGFLFQNHLSSEGFYLLRARTQLKEIVNILVK